MERPLSRFLALTALACLPNPAHASPIDISLSFGVAFPLPNGGAFSARIAGSDTDGDNYPMLDEL